MKQASDRSSSSSPTLPGVSVVVPVYNSERTVGDLVEELAATLPAIASGFEVILVDDGSSDGSWESVQALADRYTWVRGLRLMRNFGQHNALLCGIRAVRYPIVVTLDDDLQNPPGEIPKLLEKLDQGYDVVYGTPLERQEERWRALASNAVRLALGLVLGSEVGRHASSFRALRTDLRRAFEDYRSPFVSVDVLLSWGTTRFGHVPVRHEPRGAGASQYSLGKLLLLAVTMITGFSVLPLRVASLLGFALTLVGILVLFYVLAAYVLYGGSVPGFPFLASIIAIFAGAQMFALGIIGEYLARIHFRTLDRPPYTVTTEVGAR